MQHKILYTADIHGNEIQYQKLINYSIEVSADSVIIGGDIAPKDFVTDNFIQGQRKFLKNRLPELLQPLKNRLPKTKLYLMMGNDDCSANLDILKKEDGGLYNFIHRKRIKLTKDYDLVGYSYVPITPFGIKDWEKYDFSKVPVDLESEYFKRKKTNYRLEAKKSTKKGWKDFAFTPEFEKRDSIQKDLADKLFTKKAGKTVYIIHTPPNDTNLDITSPLAVSGGNHVGSMALRLFIENYQPYLTLHGHIHETVDMSDHFKSNIGSTLCLTVGNHNIGDQLAVLVFNLYEPQRAVRRII